jgi:(2Fe-2S) ferredoxin
VALPDPDRPSTAEPLSAARAAAIEHGVGSYARHVFLCVGPDCCTPEEGAAAWARLKAACAELNKRDGAAPIYRTKVGCLRICTDGPTAVVYPEGTWYAGLNPDGLRQVIDNDLARGDAVEGLVIGRNPLPSAGSIAAAEMQHDPALRSKESTEGLASRAGS